MVRLARECEPLRQHAGHARNETATKIAHPSAARRDGYAKNSGNPIEGLAISSQPSDGVIVAAVNSGLHCAVSIANEERDGETDPSACGCRRHNAHTMH